MISLSFLTVSTEILVFSVLFRCSRSKLFNNTTYTFWAMMSCSSGMSAGLSVCYHQFCSTMTQHFQAPDTVTQLMLISWLHFQQFVPLSFFLSLLLLLLLLLLLFISAFSAMLFSAVSIHAFSAENAIFIFFIYLWICPSMIFRFIWTHAFHIFAFPKSSLVYHIMYERVDWLSAQNRCSQSLIMYTPCSPIHVCMNAVGENQFWVYALSHPWKKDTPWEEL